MHGGNQGEKILVRVSARFELSTVVYMGSLVKFVHIGLVTKIVSF